MAGLIFTITTPLRIRSTRFLPRTLKKMRQRWRSWPIPSRTCRSHYRVRLHPSGQLTHLKVGAYHLRLAKELARTRPPGRELFFMDKKKLEQFKKKLESRQQELRKTVSRTEHDGRTVDDDSAQDVADRAASSYTKEFLFHQSNTERQTLQMVDNALARIREGTFGECVSCGNEINPKRLEAVPWTRHCIECQEKLEKGMLEEASR